MWPCSISALLDTSEKKREHCFRNLSSPIQNKNLLLLPLSKHILYTSREALFFTMYLPLFVFFPTVTSKRNIMSLQTYQADKLIQIGHSCNPDVFLSSGKDQGFLSKNYTSLICWSILGTPVELAVYVYACMHFSSSCNAWRKNWFWISAVLSLAWLWCKPAGNSFVIRGSITLFVVNYYSQTSFSAYNSSATSMNLTGTVEFIVQPRAFWMMVLGCLYRDFQQSWCNFKKQLVL